MCVCNAGKLPDTLLPPLLLLLSPVLPKHETLFILAIYVLSLHPHHITSTLPDLFQVSLSPSLLPLHISNLLRLTCFLFCIFSSFCLAATTTTTNTPSLITLFFILYLYFSTFFCYVDYYSSVFGTHTQMAIKHQQIIWPLSLPLCLVCSSRPPSRPASSQMTLLSLLYSKYRPPTASPFGTATSIFAFSFSFLRPAFSRHSDLVGKQEGSKEEQSGQAAHSACYCVHIDPQRTFHFQQSIEVRTHRSAKQMSLANDVNGQSMIRAK